MKFKEHQSDVVQVGDIQSNAVGIDTNNIDFIITILSTNLYSKPIESFLRETVSNAWDSHIEAGNKEPVIIELNEDVEGKKFCRIQDFGVGLSPERFDKIYRNIGSSTKRTTNDQIGGFGIGRFSALAYSDTVYITSNYEAKQYKYLMYKDGNKLSIDLIHEADTIEKNGVEVLVYLKDNYHEVSNFRNAIKRQLCYFENLYLVDELDTNFADTFNKFKIKKYENFSVQNLLSYQDMSILLGKVQYPLRIENLNKTYTSKQKGFPIALNFEIGDLEITPNREEILYTAESIAKIEEVLDASIKEIDSLISKEFTKDFQGIRAYYKIISEESYLYLMDECDNYGTPYIKIKGEDKNFTLRGIKYNEKVFKKIYDYLIYRIGFIDSTHFVSSGRISQNRVKSSISSFISTPDKYIFCDMSSVSGVTKDYIRDKFSIYSGTIHKPLSKKDLKKWYKEGIKTLEKKIATYDLSHIDSKIYKLIFLDIASNMIKYPVLTNASVPKKWLEERKEKLAEKRKARKSNEFSKDEGIHLHVLRTSGKNYKKATTDSKYHKYEDLLAKSTQKLVVYSYKDDPRLQDYWRCFNNDRITFVGVATQKMKYLKGFKNFVLIDDFMDVKYKIIRKKATAILIREELPFLSELAHLDGISDISKKLYKVCFELYNYAHENVYSNLNRSFKTNNISALEKEIFEYCKENNFFDEEIRGLLNENKEFITKAKCLLMFAEENRYSSRKSIPKSKTNLAVDYILARRIFKPDLEAAFKSKRETIFNNKIEEEHEVIEN